MNIRSLKEMWVDYCQSRNLPLDVEISDLTVAVYTELSELIKKRDLKLEQASKSLDTYKIHNHKHLAINHALAAKNQKQKDQLELAKEEIKKLKEELNAALSKKGAK